MKLIFGLLYALGFYGLFAKTIKKHPVAFYLGTYFWIVLVIMYYIMGFDKSMPAWFTSYFMDIFQRGVFSTTTFVIVMMVGVFTKPNKWSKSMMSIRGEISIIGSIFVICHNVLYGIVYFPSLFKHPELMSIQNKIAAILTLVLLVLLIPLFVTSFKSIRKKMNAKKWKKLQRLAYPFFMIIYVHVMVLYSVSPSAHILDIALYSVVFLGYAALRIRKAIIKSGERKKLN